MNCRNSVSVHLFAGGAGGTVAAVVTCPLEVVKTRLQASSQVFQPVRVTSTLISTTGTISSPYHGPVFAAKPSGILACIRHMVQTEGLRSLYKGLGPNLIGVAPARAIYFAVYAKSKKALSKGYLSSDSKLTHICSGAAAGFVTHTFTAPIWFVKTRLQLDAKTEKTNMWRCIASIYKQYGFLGFYRGLSASYFGISETVIHFVIYEHAKKRLRVYRQHTGLEKNLTGHNIFSDFMIAAGFSKTVASIIAYPHEVVRTRLRQEEVNGRRKYKSFFQTLSLIFREEGRKGLYAGLGTQLVRQVPNSSIMFMTYETMVGLLCTNDIDDEL